MGFQTDRYIVFCYSKQFYDEKYVHFTTILKYIRYWAEKGIVLE